MFVRILMSAVFALTFVHIAQSDVSVERVNENPRHPGKCWLKTYRKALVVGGDWQPPGQCLSIECSKERDGYTIFRYGCGVAVIDGVKVRPSTSKPYPACCLG